MTKRPHLLAAFCLLFLTIILSNQASALYDPGVGRFCSRDPIGYEGSPFHLHQFLDGRGLSGTDFNGLKCCLRTYWRRSYRTPWGSHSVLKCGEDYYSLYPNRNNDDGSTYADFGTEEDDNDGTPMTEICLECLDETAIGAKWDNELSRIQYTSWRNCSWFTWQLLQAGIKDVKSSKCSKQKCPCNLQKECLDTCRMGTGIFDSPQGTEKYAKCLKKRDCDPWEAYCVSYYPDL